MGRDLTAQQSFDKKIKERLKKDIGRLIPDSVVKEMVKRATNELFFDKKKVSGDSWNPEYVPAKFVSTVKELMEPRVEAAIQDYMKTVGMAELIQEVVRDELPKVIAQVMVSALQGTANNIGAAVGNSIQQIQNNNQY